MRWIQSTSAKSLQIDRHLIRLLTAQTHGRHFAPRFDDSRIVNPRHQAFERVTRRAGGYRLPAHEMREIRTVSAICSRACNCVAVDAGRLLEDPLSWGGRLSDVRWLALLLNPAVEIFPRVNVHAQKHLGMLGPAVLRALPQVKARLARIHPHAVGVVRNQIRFSAQARHPETVVRIRGKQREKSRGRVRRVAYWDVQFIRGHYL